MFGRGKSSEAATQKPKKRSSLSFPWKNWLLNHIEKIAMGLFLAITGYLIYDGLSAGSYDRSKSPEDLSSQAQRAKTEIETVNHWNAIKADRPMPNDFVKQVEDARKDMDATPYVIVNIPERVMSVSGEKRGDPELFAPIEVQGHSFFGAIAVNSPKASKADELPNAPPVGDGRKPRKPPTASTPARTLIPIYDVGYQPKPGAAPIPAPAPIPGRLGRPVEYKVVPKVTYFNVITAAVPHEMMAESYKKEFASATAYFPDRDSPNYLGYEVQRVDVTDNPGRNIDEAEWKEATSCMPETQLKQLTTWAGICDEVAVANYVVDKVLTMPIPPILLTDYRPLASHPLVPRLDLVRKTSVGSGDMEDMDSSDDTTVDDSGSDDSSEGTGFPSAAAEEDPKNIPKALEVTDYKLLRFVDFDVKLNRVYRYRVRLALEDPNYTRSKNFTPRTSDMKPDTVTRVQQLEAADAEAISKLPPGTKFDRNSKRYTPWSEPSSTVETRRPVELYSSKVTGAWTAMKTSNGKSEVAVESMPLKAAIAYAEWAPDYGLLVTRKTDVERGTVLSGVPKELGADVPGLDAIHPVSKVIKWLAGFKYTDPVTVVDIRGGQPLEAGKRPGVKDPLPSGGEVVAYDPVTGELIISREFEATMPFQMLGFTDEKPADSAPTSQPSMTK